MWRRVGALTEIDGIDIETQVDARPGGLLPQRPQGAKGRESVDAAHEIRDAPLSEGERPDEIVARCESGP